MLKLMLFAVLILSTSSATAEPSANASHTACSNGQCGLGEPAMSSPSAQALIDLHATGNWNRAAKSALAKTLWGEAGIMSEYARVTLSNGYVSKHRIKLCNDATRERGDCVKNKDWAVIPWVLLRRWEQTDSNPRKRPSFAKLIRRYSSPLKRHLATRQRELAAIKRGDMREVRQIQRRRFLQGLRLDGANLNRLHKRLTGRNAPAAFHHGWASIRDAVDSWGMGLVPDECPTAQHWDMPGASVSKRLASTCSGTRNIFYTWRRQQRS